jgi:hypothetical protein
MKTCELDCCVSSEVDGRSAIVFMETQNLNSLREWEREGEREKGREGETFMDPKLEFSMRREREGEREKRREGARGKEGSKIRTTYRRLVRTQAKQSVSSLQKVAVKTIECRFWPLYP